MAAKRQTPARRKFVAVLAFTAACPPNTPPAIERPRPPKPRIPTIRKMTVTLGFSLYVCCPLEGGGMEKISWISKRVYQRTYAIPIKPSAESKMKQSAE